MDPSWARLTGSPVDLGSTSRHVAFQATVAASPNATLAFAAALAAGGLTGDPRGTMGGSGFFGRQCETRGLKMGLNVGL